MWKAIKYTFAFCAVGDSGERGTFDSVSNLKYFIHTAKFRWPIKLLWPPNFLSFSCGPLGGGGRMYQLENHWSKIHTSEQVKCVTAAHLLNNFMLLINQHAESGFWSLLSCLFNIHWASAKRDVSSPLFSPPQNKNI